MTIEKNKKIAIVAGNRLGDGLIIQLLTYNLHLNGYDVTLFNSPLLTLKSWFPWCKLEPFFHESECEEKLKDFDTAIFQHQSRHYQACEALPCQKFVLYGEKLFMQRRSLVDIYFDFCKKVLQLQNIKRSNGIEIDDNLIHRKNGKRVVIHPTSLRPEKNWPKHKFVQLGKKLQHMGYIPIFTVSPKEKKDWEFLKDEGLSLVIFEKLSDLASYIYESGYMIGNDSGIAHLSSSIGIPSLVLFIRAGVAARWKPNFLPAVAILPKIKLPGPKLQEKFWKKLTTVNQVANSFKKLVMQS